MRQPGSCGWTPDFEQLQLRSQTHCATRVAAGLRILNSYNGIQIVRATLRVAAGLRILNSYNYWEDVEQDLMLRLDSGF